jgi:hypothetical protein
MTLAISGTRRCPLAANEDPILDLQRDFSSTTVCGLRALIRANSLDVLFISETKISPSLVSPTLNHLGFYLMTHLAPSGTCDGHVLAWRLGVELESFISNKNNISAWCYSNRCYSNPPNSPWILSCIYGPFEKKNKLAF